MLNSDIRDEVLSKNLYDTTFVNMSFLHKKNSLCRFLEAKCTSNVRVSISGSDFA